jgi:septal ring-binding cell division protein DamX
MAKGGGDMVLGGRHLVGIFALLVVVMGMVFTLGYLLGRSRYEDQARSSASAATGDAEPAPKTPTPGAAASGPASEPSGSAAAPAANWDFYRSGEPAKTAELAPAPASSASAPSKSLVASAKPVESAPAKAAAAVVQPAPVASAHPGSALIPKGAITLQVAALLHEGDALALAQALQEKKFPAIVTTPSVDKYYRVQIGPYPDAKSATAARHDLEKQGFKAIVRR